MHLYLPSIVALILLSPSDAGKSSCACDFANKMSGHIYNIFYESKTSTFNFSKKGRLTYNFEFNAKYNRSKIYKLGRASEYIQDYENETMYSLLYEKGTITNCTYIDLHDSLKLEMCLPKGYEPNEGRGGYGPIFYHKKESGKWYKLKAGTCDVIGYYVDQPYNSTLNISMHVSVDNYESNQYRSYYFPDIPVKCVKVAIDSFSK